MKSTKKALLLSIMSMLLCVAMLMGTTFAWFTDKVESGVNKIVAGNLDIEVQYTNDNGAHWADLEGSASVFSSNLWEPGHTEYVTLKITNKGTLALKYRMNVTPINEKGGINMAGENFKLSDYLVFGTTTPADTQPTYDRDAARTAVGTAIGLNQSALTKNSTLEKGKIEYITLVVYMPEDVGNEANYKTGTTAPEIELGIKFIATQLTSENDSFGNDYDDVDYPTIDTVITYNYYPQITQTAQLVKNNDVAEKGNDDANVLAEDNTITINSKETVAEGKPFASVTFANNAVAFSATSNTAAVTLEAKKNASGNISVSDDKESVTYELDVTTNASFKPGTIFTLKFFVGEGKQAFTLDHSGNAMTNVTGLNGTADTYVYDAATGYVTMQVSHFSPFTTKYDPPVAAVGTKAYYSLESAAEAAGDATVTLIRDVKEATVEDVKLNLNGNKVENLTVTGEAIIDDGSAGKNGNVDNLNLQEGATAQLDDTVEPNVTGEGDVLFTDIPADPEEAAKKYKATAGGVAFTNIQTAFKTVEDGDEILILNDITEDKVISFSGKDVKLDLGGKTMTLSGNHDGFVLENGASLTVENGTFELANATDSNDVFYLTNNSNDPGEVTELTLGKDVVINVTKGNSAVHANGQGGGKVVVNFNGTINADRPAGASQFAALQALYNAELNIGADAEVNVKAEFNNFSMNNDVVIIMAWGKNNVVNVNGGTFTADVKNAFLSAMQIGNYNGSNPTQFNVNGGTFDLSNDGGESYAFTAYYTTGGKYNVQNCTVNGTLKDLTLVAFGGNLDITVTGGQYSCDPSSVLKNMYKATLQDNSLYLVEIDPDAMDPLEVLFTGFTSGNVEVPERLVLNQPLTLSSLKDGDGKPCYEAQLDNIKTTIVLNDTLTTGKYDWNYGAFRIKNGTELTIEAGPNGKFINTECNALVSLENNSKLTVKSGEFQSPKGAWQSIFMGGFFSDSYNGEINIEGGVFKFDGADKDNQVPFFSTNKDAVQYNGFIIDPHGYNPSFIKLNITGGTFYNCNPTGYTAAGYKVESQVIGNDMVYTVVAEAN